MHQNREDKFKVVARVPFYETEPASIYRAMFALSFEFLSSHNRFWETLNDFVTIEYYQFEYNIECLTFLP